MYNLKKNTKYIGNITYRGDGSPLMVWSAHQDGGGEILGVIHTNHGDIDGGVPRITCELYTPTYDRDAHYANIRTSSMDKHSIFASWHLHTKLTGVTCDGTGAEGVIASWELYP